MNKIIVLDKHEMVIDRDVYDHMVNVLRVIHEWKLPEAQENGRPCSFEGLYGSNGARDFMRGIAGRALPAVYVSRL